MLTQKTFGYIGLRKRIFSAEIRHFLKQVEQFMLLVIFFLGTAVPALLFAALLAFGIILDNDSPVSQLLFITWALLASQSLLLVLFKQAILGKRYGLFVSVFEKSRFKRYTCDIVLAIACNPIFALYLVVMGAIPIQHWLDLPHSLLLLWLLSVSMLITLYSTPANNAFLCLALILVPFTSGLPLHIALSVFCLCQLCLLFVFRFVRLRRFSLSAMLPNLLAFWVLLSTSVNTKSSQGTRSEQRHNILFISCAFATLVIVMAHYSAAQFYGTSEQYAFVVHIIGAQFVVLATSSIQLNITKTIKQFPLFFAQYNHNLRFARLQYIVSFSATIFMLGASALAFGNAWVMTHLIVAGACILTARYSARAFIVVWLSTGLATSVVIYQLAS